MRRPDTRHTVTIVGAGIVGICTALSLLERGMIVTLVDRDEPGQATSMGNAGVVSPWSIIPQSLPGTWKTIPTLLFGYGRPLSVHPKVALKMLPWGWRFLRQGREKAVRKTAGAMYGLCGPSIDIYQKHLRGTGAEDLIRESLYVHAFRDGSRANLQGLDYRIRSEFGAEVELVGKDQLSRIEPALSSEFGAAILIKDQARVRSPGRLGRVLAQKALALGATFLRAEARRISRSGEKWRVQCVGNDLISDRIVVCLGAWSPTLLRATSLKIPLMAERGYHVAFTDPGIEISNSVMDMDAKVVASSMEGGVRVAGQAEFAPVDAPPSVRRQKMLHSVALAAFPGLNAQHARFWMGQRPSFPDSLPMLGEVPGEPGLFVNFGHSHYGLMMAPKSGDLIAQVIGAERPNIDLAPYAPERF